MKKLTLLVVAALTTFVAGAQIRFGLKAGVSLVNLYHSNYGPGTSSQAALSFNYGVMGYLPLSQNFGLQAEGVLSGQGSKDKYSLNNVSATSTNSFPYFNVPVLLKFQSNFGFFAEAGPQLGILLSAKSKDNNGTSTDVKQFVSSTDIAAVLGIGYNFNDNLGIDLRYNAGLSNINKAADDKVRNTVAQLGVFYLFGKNKYQKK